MTRIYVHPLPVRVWHWINAVGFVVLIVTAVVGALIMLLLQRRNRKRA